MEICIAKYTPTGRIEPTSPYHSSLMLYLLRHRLLCKGLFLFFDLLSPEFVLGKTTFRSDKMNSKCGRPEISKISPKTHVLRFSNVISHLHTIYTQLVRFELLSLFLSFSLFLSLSFSLSLSLLSLSLTLSQPYSHKFSTDEPAVQP